ncbi:fungal-specific transcription factor [Xylariales sp. AK1849]|nr:fungal-specific transcription factor [Xylariales sp. AK1849]KAI0137499.1 fungal-specific transcription factor [Xylariales sp. AK1849]
MATTTKRRKRACDSCYKRKIHCDEGEPQCNWCTHHGLACTFNRPTRAKKVAKARKDGDKKGISERIERLEQILGQNGTQKDDHLPESSTASLGVPSPNRRPDRLDSTDPDRVEPPGPNPYFHSPIASFGKLHFAGYHLGEISSYNGIPMFSSNGQTWIQTRTGQTPTFPELGVTPWHNKQHAYEASLSQVLDLELPDRKITEQYFSIYCTSPMRFIFPFVDTVLFKHTIDVAYDVWHGPFSTEPASAKACVLSFLSLTCLMEGKLDTTPIDSDTCAAKAQYIFPQLLLDTNVTGLQTVLMLCMFHLFSGKFQTAAMFHSMSCRIVFILGGHTHPVDPAAHVPADETDHSSRVKSHLRKCFWLCYIFDKDISLRTGHPPAIDDQHCDLTFPKGYQFGIMRVDNGSTPFLPCDLKLSIIKSKSSKLLYSAEALLKSDAELLRDIRELDHELEIWRLSIDPRFRPTLSFRSGDLHLASSIAKTDMMHVMITHFEYHYLMATIHQATGRCRAWANGKSGEMEGVSSSLTLSVEASRSTLVYLRAAVPFLFGECFWIVLFYPMSAVLTVFCNLLLNPLCSRAQEDLELLKVTPELIKAIRIRRLTPREAIHMTMIEDFVAELTRLGACAITKAHHGQNPDGLGLN